MAIELPHVLKNMNLFVDGRGYAGRVDEIKLPKLTLKTEEHRAGGMDIPVELELGMDKLEAELTISDFDPEVFKLFGLLDSTRTQITLRGAIQAQGTVARPVIVNLKLPLEMGVLSFVQNVDKELRNGGKASTCGIHAGI